MEQKLAKRRAKVEGLKDQQEELRRQKRQNSDAQRQKLEAQLVSVGFSHTILPYSRNVKFDHCLI